MNRKYNKKMTDMIQHAYKTAGNGANQLDTATRILADYKTLWPGSANIDRLTAQSIRSKFQTLKTHKIYVATKKTATVKKTTSTPSCEITKDDAMKQLIIHLMDKSDKLNLNVKEGMVTVQFNL